MAPDLSFPSATKTIKLFALTIDRLRQGPGRFHIASGLRLHRSIPNRVDHRRTDFFFDAQTTSQHPIDPPKYVS